jgi:hypothetical protein
MHDFCVQQSHSAFQSRSKAEFVVVETSLAVERQKFLAYEAAETKIFTLLDAIHAPY